MLLFAVGWLIRIVNLIKEGKKKLLKMQKKTNLNPIISQDKIEIKIPK